VTGFKIVSGHVFPQVLRGWPSRNSPPRLSRNSPPWAVCLPGVGLAKRFALHSSTGGWKGADGEEKYLDARSDRVVHPLARGPSPVQLSASLGIDRKTVRYAVGITAGRYAVPIVMPHRCSGSPSEPVIDPDRSA
jgi:hypothetical protein